jgi:hypothetical protein
MTRGFSTNPARPQPVALLCSAPRAVGPSFTFSNGLTRAHFCMNPGTFSLRSCARWRLCRGAPRACADVARYPQRAWAARDQQRNDRDAHEKWADALEMYFREGKALVGGLPARSRSSRPGSGLCTMHSPQRTPGRARSLKTFSTACSPQNRKWRKWTRCTRPVRRSSIPPQSWARKRNTRHT